MKVYKIEFEVNHYRSLLPLDEETEDFDLLSFDGTSKKEKWPLLYDAEIDNDEALTPDVYCFDSGAMLLTDKALSIFGPLLGSAEFLPVGWKNGAGVIANIVGYVDCLNEETTEWVIDKDSGKRLFIKKYYFDKVKLPTQMLFKITQQCFELFCVDFDDGSDNFKSIVESNKLSGIRFEEIWNDEGGAKNGENAIAD